MTTPEAPNDTPTDAVPADAVPADAGSAAVSDEATEAASPAAAGGLADSAADSGTASDGVGTEATTSADEIPAEAAQATQPVEAEAAAPEAGDAAASADAVPGDALPAGGGNTVVLGKADPRVAVEAEPVAPVVAVEAEQATAAIPAQRESAVQPPVWVQPQPLPQAAPQGGYGAPQAQGVVWAVPVEYLASAPRKERPWLRTVARWGSAAAVAVVVAAVSAALVALPARTDIPGLETPSDGRWSFPALNLPALPPGQSVDNDVSQHVHRVDLRKLLLPAPAGAARASQGWIAQDAFLKLLATPTPTRQAFDDAGLRHIAATGWTMPDGTRTDVYLQQFRSTYSANAADSAEALAGVLQAAQGQQLPISPDLGAVSNSSVREVLAGAGAPDTVYGYFQVGDVEMVVVMTNPHKVPIVNFEQVVQLENRLLSA